MAKPDDISRRTLRLPGDALAFLEAEAKENLTSLNSEIVRSIRLRMRAATGEGLGNSAPAAATHAAGLASGDISHNG